MGDTLDHYFQVLDKASEQMLIYEGGHSFIYQASDIYGRRVVFKHIKLGGQLHAESFLEDFYPLLSQFQALSAPGLLKVIDGGVSGGELYLVLEYLIGQTLKSRILKEQQIGRYDLDERVLWLIQICDALSALHQAGLLHRDLKAANVMLSQPGDRIVLFDYGFDQQLLINSGFLEGNELFATPYSVSPERIVGEPDTVQSDLYALGVIFHELFLAEPPFNADDLSGLLSAHLFDEPPKLTGKLALFDPIFQRLMDKLPEYRFETADDVKQAILAVYPMELAV